MSSRQWIWFLFDRNISRCGDCGRQPASEEEDDKSWRCWGKIWCFNSKNMVIIWKIFPKPCIKLHGKNWRRKNEKIFDNLRELKNQKAFQWKRNYAQTSIMENHFETVIINTGDKIQKYPETYVNMSCWLNNQVRSSEMKSKSSLRICLLSQGATIYAIGPIGGQQLC